MEHGDSWFCCNNLFAQGRQVDQWSMVILGFVATIF
jgi:hypothetical protein